MSFNRDEKPNIAVTFRSQPSSDGKTQDTKFSLWEKGNLFDQHHVHGRIDAGAVAQAANMVAKLTRYERVVLKNIVDLLPED